MRKSSDICRDSLLVMGEWVYHCGIYEWPQVCGREVERGREGERERRTGRNSITSEWCHSGSGVLRLRRRRWFISAPESRCQPGCGLVWESNLGRIEHVTCDNVHPAWEPEDHIDNVRFIRPRRGSNYEQPCSARAEIGQQLFFFFFSLSEWFNSCFSCLYFSLRFNVIRPQVVCFCFVCLFPFE